MAGTTTGMGVFTAAMALSDNLVNGVADVSDNADYKARCMAIINDLGQELYQYSDTKVITTGKRPVFTPITALTSVLDLDDGLALGVLPSGVVAYLFTIENPSLANYHEQKYNEKVAMFRNFPQEFTPITDVYNTAYAPWNGEY
jgi:hypothetical protein